MCAPQSTLTQSKPLVETIVINRETNINSPPRKKIKKGPNKNSNKQSKKDATKNNKKNQKKNLRKQQNRKTTQEQQQKAKLEAEQEISLEEQGKYLALDCEMVGVGEGGVTSALARVSIVDYNNAILLDTHVKVDEPVTDYRTFVSGIREEHLQSDTAMDFAQCQSIVKKILKDKILVGHALRNDLGVLDLEHPWYNCRDTAKYEPFMKKDKNSDILKPKKLKVLAETKLNRIIQRVGEEHCPIEDATAALDLYKKARVKWEKAVEYKMSRTKAIAHDL